MQTLVICLALALGVAVAVPAPDRCEVSSWGPWSKCARNPICPSRDQLQSRSYPKPAVEGEVDQGRITMKKMMSEKMKLWRELSRCRADGSCPELAQKASQGFTACDANGMAGDFPCWNADLEYFFTIEELGAVSVQDPTPEANDVWGWTDTEGNGDEYVIQGLSGGTSFVRITPITAPVVLAFLPSRAGAPVIWRDIKVVGNYAYIVSECSKHGMQVVDMTRFRGKTTFERITADAEYALFGNAHNIAANVETKFLYVIGATDRAYPLDCLGGLHVIDVNEPLNPTYVGCFGGDGYVHDTQCVIYRGPQTQFQGREICFCFNEDTFTIVDVHDKTNMRQLSRTGYTGAAYTHQGWVTDDHRVVLMDDEQDEQQAGINNNGTRTYMWDVSDLTNPVLRFTHYSSEPAIDHNLYIQGEYAFQSNYKAGLRILHIDQVNFSLREVAYFDNYPPVVTTGFGGTWSNYPYFESGVVAASSIEYGLFLISPKWDDITKAVAEHKAHATQTRTRQVESYTKGAQCPALMESRPCAAPAC